MRLVLGFLFLPLLLLSLRPTIASAHAEYLRSDPPADSVLEIAPKLLTITFTEPIETYLLDVSVFSEAGVRVDSGDAHRSIDGRQATVGLGNVGVGSYVVRWRAMGVDGHILTSAFNFGVGKAPSSTATATPGRSPAPDAVVRWITLLAACALIGGVLFRQLVLAPAVSTRMLGPETLTVADRQLLSVIWLGFSFFLGASVLQLVEQLLAAGADANLSALGGVLGSLSGQLWIGRIALLGALGVTLAQCEPTSTPSWRPARLASATPVPGWLGAAAGGDDIRAIALARLQVRPDYDGPRRDPAPSLHEMSIPAPREGAAGSLAPPSSAATISAPRDRWWWMAAATGVAILALFSVGGHAAVTKPVWLTVPVDWLHLVAAVLWVGGIFYLAVFWASRRTAPGLFGALLKRFSIVAGVCLATLVPTGLFAAWIFVPSPAETVNSPYGLVLLAKIALVAGMCALGFVHWRAAQQTDDAASPIARSLVAETMLGAAVLATVGLLVNLPPAQERAAAQAEAAEMARPEGAIAAEALIFAGRAGQNLVTLTVDPPRPGNLRLTIDVLDDLGSPVDDAAVSVQARPADPLAPPTASAGARPDGPGRYVAAWNQATGRADLLVSVTRPGVRAVSASFAFDVPVSGAKDILRRADSTMNQLRSLSEHKILEGTAGGTHAVTYTYVSPDRMRATDSSGFEIIAALGQRFERSGGDWKSEPWPDPHGFRWPTYSYATSANVRLLGIQELAGMPHFVVTFVDDQAARNTVWVDVGSYAVRRHEVLSAGHSITTDFSDFNGDLAVHPPSLGTAPGVPGSMETGESGPMMPAEPPSGVGSRGGNVVGPQPTPPANDGPSRRLLSSARVLNFADLATDDTAVSGRDASGVVDWGSGVWRLGRRGSGSPGFRLDAAGTLADRGTFSFVEPSFLVSLGVRNSSESVPAAVALSCDGEQTKRVTILAGQTGTIETSWTKPCSTVTVESSDGLSTIFDNMVVYSP